MVRMKIQVFHDGKKKKEKIHLPYMKEMASLNQSQHSSSKVNK